MEATRRFNIIIVVLLIATLVLLIVQNNKIKTLESQLSYVSNNLKDSIHTEMQYVQQYIDMALQQAKSLIDTYSIEYSGVDTDNKKANINMTFQLKEQSPNSKIQIAAVPVDASVPEAYFDAVSDGGLQFKSEFALSYLTNYSFDIYESGENGYMKKLNTEAIYLYLKDDFSNRTVVNSFGSGVGRDGVDIKFDIFNQTFGEESFRMSKVELIITAEGKEVYRLDVTNNSLADSSDIADYMVKVASGEIEPLDKNPDIQLQKAQMGPDGIERGYYVVAITHKEIIGREVDSNDIPVYEFYVEVTYNNGEKVRVK